MVSFCLTVKLSQHFCLTFISQESAVGVGGGIFLVVVAVVGFSEWGGETELFGLLFM